jgi:hypothetical protein
MQPIGYTVTHDHALPDVDADPGTYPYPDGCAVIVRDGHSYFIPNGITHTAEPVFADPPVRDGAGG